MSKAPNYQFERRERDRLKANKAADKAAAKREQQARAREGAAPLDAPTAAPEAPYPRRTKPTSFCEVFLKRITPIMLTAR